MPSDSFRVIVVSSPDWTTVSAQVWSGERRICDVRNLHGKLSVEIFANPDEPTWNLAHDEFVAALQKVKEMIG